MHVSLGSHKGKRCLFGGDCMKIIRKMKFLIKKIFMNYKAAEIWDAKMSEHLSIEIVSVPTKK